MYVCMYTYNDNVRQDLQAALRPGSAIARHSLSPTPPGVPSPAISRLPPLSPGFPPSLQASPLVTTPSHPGAHLVCPTHRVKARSVISCNDIHNMQVHIHDGIVDVEDDCIGMKGGKNWLVENMQVCTRLHPTAPPLHSLHPMQLCNDRSA